MSSRPFRILGLQQVAIGHTDKTALAHLWIELLGLCVESSFRSESENVDEDIVRLGTGPHSVELDLMQPIDAARAPRVHEPALNHLGLWVEGLDEAVTWLKERGVRFAGGVRQGAAGHRIAFIHPKGNAAFPLGGQGVLIELVEAPPEIIGAFHP